jgi:phosphatidylglycerophosphatase C
MGVHIAIYDLDRTLTRRPTFTPFLAFAARRIAAWRLSLFPVWIAAMIGYRMGLCSRTSLKRFGMKLMVGNVGLDRLEKLGDEYAEARIRDPGLMPAVMAMVEDDRNSGAEMMVATAAFGFYAQGFAERLGFEHLIATLWNGAEIPGGNCYGETKKKRVLDWFASQGIDRNGARVRFLSDSFADAPLLDWADEPLFVTSSQSEAAKARARGWKVIDPIAL